MFSRPVGPEPKSAIVPTSPTCVKFYKLVNSPFHRELQISNSSWIDDYLGYLYPYSQISP